MHVVYGLSWAISIVVIVELIYIDMHYYVVSLKVACSLVQKGGLVACPKLRRWAWSSE